MRPIDGEDLLRKICGDSCGCEPSDCGYIDEYRKERCKAGQYVEKQPTVDAAPVKHGRWEYSENIYDESTWVCSICKEPWTLIDGTPQENNMKYCPNCGAKMDLEE